MPTYQYACTSCEHRFDAVQAFTDATLTNCPECGGRLRKLYGSVGVVFKGSGFYRTDSRNAASAKAESSVPAGAKSDSGSKSESGSKTDSGSSSNGSSASNGGSSSNGGSASNGSASSKSTSPASAAAS